MPNLCAQTFFFWIQTSSANHFGHFYMFTVAIGHHIRTLFIDSSCLKHNFKKMKISDDNYTLASLSEFDEIIFQSKLPECSSEIIFFIQSHTEVTILCKNCWKMSKLRVFLQMCLTNVPKLFFVPTDEFSWSLRSFWGMYCSNSSREKKNLVVHPIYRVTIMIFDSWLMNHVRWSIRKKLQIVCRGWGCFWRVYIMCIVN